MRSSSEIYKFKIIIVGDSGVGKSSISYQYTDKKWMEVGTPTLGIDYNNKYFERDGKSIRLELWDTAGQETYHSIISSYYRNACLAIVVYDITNRESFNSLDHWITDIRERQALPLVIIGNKKDLNTEREISYEEGQLFANRYNALFSEISAKSYSDVSEIFSQISSQLVEYSDQNILPNDKSDKIPLIPDNKNNDLLNHGLLSDRFTTKRKCRCCF